MSLCGSGSLTVHISSLICNQFTVKSSQCTVFYFQKQLFNFFYIVCISVFTGIDIFCNRFQCQLFFALVHVFSFASYCSVTALLLLDLFSSVILCHFTLLTYLLFHFYYNLFSNVKIPPLCFCTLPMSPS